MNNKRKIIYLLAIIILLLFVGAYWRKQKAVEKTREEAVDSLRWQEWPVTIGTTAPLFSLKSSRGIEVGLSDFSGQNVLLLFASTQCEFCQNELPDLKEFADKYRGSVIVLGIYHKESPRSLGNYEESEKINFIMLSDEKGKVFEDYEVTATPHHVLVGKDGKIAALWPAYGNLIALESLLKNLE